MKIRNRLALSFSLSAAVILPLMFLLTFFYVEDVVREQLRTHTVFLLTLYFTSLLFLYGCAYWLAGLLIDPIRQKMQGIKEILATDLHQRMPEDNPKDLPGALAATYNDLLDRLQNSFELQRNFISNASHEIKNPLTAIMGETEVCLEKKRTTEAYIESLTNIAREADRLDALVDNLLSLAKTEFGNTAVSLEDVRLDEVLMEAKANLDKSQPQNQTHLDFTELPQNPEWLSIQGNHNLLRIALTNLMENAAKFSKNKEVQVKLTATQKELLLSIRDQGIGIPGEELQKIFQPFYRARNARSFRGFGIGLSLTDKIIRMHKGKMQINSEEGKGTTIEILFVKE